MSKVFISYRRSDSTDVAGRIYDHLCLYFRRENLFKDVDSIPPGADFEKAISDTIKACDVVVVIIGREWLTAASSKGVRRLDVPDDLVRIELEEALARDIPIIPVLVGGAEMPSPEVLPNTLRQLAFRQAIPVRPDPDFGSDVRRLVHALRKTTKGGNFYTRISYPGRLRTAVIAVALITLLLSVAIGIIKSSYMTGDNSPNVGSVPAANKPYMEMTKEEKQKFIEQQARRISGMLGDTPYTFDFKALSFIQFWVDSYAARVNNGQKGLWREDLRFVLQRGDQNAPAIIKAFKDKNVPPIIGLYIAMIETEYTNIRGAPNANGAIGMFNVLPPTAQHYGFSATDLTDNEKSAQMAASYMSDQITEWGRDTVNVTFAIACFNRASTSVRRDLRAVLDSPQKERSFWTIVAERGQLSEEFKDNEYNFVPRFFAAAIVGENPQVFGVPIQPLSTHTEMPTEQR